MRLLQSMGLNVTSELTVPRMENAGAEVQDFDSVVRVHRRRIYRFLLASLQDQDLAETMTQDCFLKAYRGRNDFRGDSSVRSWLMRIATNLVKDFARSRRLQFWKRARVSTIDPVQVSEWMPDSEKSPEALAVLRNQVEVVWRATDTLSERQRTVFILRFVEDMDLLEIAAATGLTEGAVKVYLFRALRTIRKRMREKQ